MSDSEIAPGPPVTGNVNSGRVGEYLTGQGARIHTTVSHHVLRNPTGSDLAGTEHEYLRDMASQLESRPGGEIFHGLLWRLPQRDNIPAGLTRQASTWVPGTSEAMPCLRPPPPSSPGRETSDVF